MRKTARDAASKTAFALAEKGLGQRAEDHYEAVRGGRAFVDDVVVSEGDALKRAFGRLPVKTYG